MKVKTIRYDDWVATLSGENGYPQTVMKKLGITYKHSCMNDKWWFWLPENIPDDLPDFIHITEVDPMESIGFGLTEKVARELLAELDKEKA